MNFKFIRITTINSYIYKLAEFIYKEVTAVKKIIWTVAYSF